MYRIPPDAIDQWIRPAHDPTRRRDLAGFAAAALPVGRAGRQRVAERAGWPKLAYPHLSFDDAGRVTHEPTGRGYRIVHRHVSQVDQHIAGYFIDQRGDPVFLELAHDATETP